MDDTTATPLAADPRELTYDVEAVSALDGHERARAIELRGGPGAAGDVRAIDAVRSLPDR
jgi:hypothetical protein